MGDRRAQGCVLAAAGLRKAMEALYPALAEYIEGEFVGPPVDLLGLADLCDEFSKMLRQVAVLDESTSKDGTGGMGIRE